MPVPATPFTLPVTVALDASRLHKLSLLAVEKGVTVQQVLEKIINDRADQVEQPPTDIDACVQKWLAFCVSNPIAQPMTLKRIAQAADPASWASMDTGAHRAAGHRFRAAVGDGLQGVGGIFRVVDTKDAVLAYQTVALQTVAGGSHG